MKTAAIYCRVSTDVQEQEGTSLQTQFESCREYCQNKKRRFYTPLFLYINLPDN